ncbi:MAG: hypothetical protein IIX70_02995 [Oscillospiraceae bacterium]|nr:hypothetical protein [Oscillospiraceae bacterium]
MAEKQQKRSLKRCEKKRDPTEKSDFPEENRQKKEEKRQKNTEKNDAPRFFSVRPGKGAGTSLDL